MDCTIEKTIDIIGKRWSLLILLELYKGKQNKRYTYLKSKLSNITPKMLSMRLKELESEELITKAIDTSSIPIKTTYSLTKSGLDLIKIIKEFKNWSLKWKVDNKICKRTNCLDCDI